MPPGEVMLAASGSLHEGQYVVHTSGKHGLAGAPKGDEQAIVVAVERLEAGGGGRVAGNPERLTVPHPVPEAQGGGDR